MSMFVRKVYTYSFHKSAPFTLTDMQLKVICNTKKHREIGQRYLRGDMDEKPKYYYMYIREFITETISGYDSILGHCQLLTQGNHSANVVAKRME